MQEGDLLSAFRNFLTNRSWIVAFARPNQVTIYFQTPFGKKYPDLAAVLGKHLLILEAKVNATNLFKSNQQGSSDCDAMIYLKENVSAQKGIRDNISARFFGDLDDSTIIVPGLIAGINCDRLHPELSEGLTFIQANITSPPVIIADPYSLF